MSDKGIKLTPRVFNKILGTPKMLIECKQSSTPLPGKSRKSLRFSQNFSLDMSGISQSSFVEQPTFGRQGKEEVLDSFDHNNDENRIIEWRQKMKMFDENNNIPVCDPSKPAFGRKLKDDEQSLEARKIFQKELKKIKKEPGYSRLSRKPILGTPGKNGQSRKKKKNRVSILCSKIRVPHNASKLIKASNCSSKSFAVNKPQSKSKISKAPKLLTAERAKIRLAQDAVREEQEKEMEVLKEQKSKEEKRMKKKALTELRETMIFKANPIRKYVPLPNIKKRAVTIPISPNLSKGRKKSQ